MKRIRYKKTEREGIVVSTKVLKSERTGAEYLVYLDLNESTYKIKNINSENVHRGGENITNLNVLKRTVKARLERMGVRFSEEERERTFGLCPKGYSQKQHEEKSNFNI